MHHAHLNTRNDGNGRDDDDDGNDSSDDEVDGNKERRTDYLAQAGPSRPAHALVKDAGGGSTRDGRSDDEVTVEDLRSLNALLTDHWLELGPPADRRGTWREAREC